MVLAVGGGSPHPHTGNSSVTTVRGTGKLEISHCTEFWRPLKSQSAVEKIYTRHARGYFCPRTASSPEF